MRITGKPKPFLLYKRNEKKSYETDFEFYIDQKGPRVQSSGPVDISYSKKEKMKFDDEIRRHNLSNQQPSTSFAPPPPRKQDTS